MENDLLTHFSGYIYVTEIDSGCIQYQNLQIRDIVNQTPRDTVSDHVALRSLAHNRC